MRQIGLSRIKHKEQSEYVDRTQRQYETVVTTIQHKFKFGNSMLEKATVGEVTV